MGTPAKPRLLVLASTYPRWPGDPEPAFVHELARRLVDRFAVRVLCPHAPGAPAREVMDGVEVVRLRYAPARLETLVNDGGIVANLKRSPWKWLLVPAYGLSLAWGVRRQFATWRPDVVHAHWLIPQGLVALAAGVGLRAPPMLVTSHGADLYALRTWPLPRLKRWVAERARALTVVSAAMIDELARLGVPPGKAQVRPMGVDMHSRFVPDAGVERAPAELLFVGRLVEKKGLVHLVDALPAILAARPEARLTVAGFGPEEAALRARCATLGVGHAVDFLGAVGQDALPALYRRATVFVAPFVQAASGDQEGLGLVMVEAAACGCPVIASDLPAVRDVIEDRVPPGDAVALAARVLAMLAEPPAARAARADALRARLLARLDWQPVAQGYADLLAGLVVRP
jgi:glycosyltransferase involved in cell wall biosynthesis